MTRKATEEADRVNQLQVEGVLQNMDSWLSIWEKSAQSFLIGRLDIIRTRQTDSTWRMVIRDKDIPELRKSVYQDLQEFLHANPNIWSASILVDPSAFPTKYGRGWGPTVEQDSMRIFDLAYKYNFAHSKSYKRIKRDGRPIWHIPSRESGGRGKIVMYYIPLYRQNGDFFGIFTINVGLSTLRKKLRASLPYGQEGSSIVVMDKNGEIICSTYDFYEQYDNYKDLLKYVFNDHKATQSQSNAKNYVIDNVEGTRYHVYYGKLGNVPWRTISVCIEEYVYKGLEKSKNIMTFVSFFGIFLILGCSWLIFLQMRSSFIEKAAAQEELKMAAQVQMSILKGSETQKLVNSETHKLNAFIRPAKMAGGDLYDYVERDSKLIFCIGDVSGKGMPAALFMTQVVSLFRNAVSHHSEPSQIVSEINNVISQNNPDMTFCTFFCGVLQSGVLTFCNAGHNAPVLISETAQPSFLSVKPNLALGLMEGFPFTSESITFNITDTLVMYTDGVTEAKDKKHELFGEERLLQLLSSIQPHTTSQQINQHILSSIETFTHGAQQSDDITLFTI